MQKRIHTSTTLPPCVLAALLSLALAAPAEPRLTRSPPPVFEAEYSLHRSGIKVAKMRQRIAPLGDSRFEYSSEIKTIGMVSLFRKDHIVENSVWTFQDNELRPERYRYRRSGGKKNRVVAMRFDRQARMITDTESGETWPMPADSTALDKLLYKLALMLDLEAGASEVAYTIADGAKIKQYAFEKIGAERIRVPLGEFDAVKMIRYKDQGRRSVIFWCAEDLRFLPVKVESIGKDRSKTTALIQSLRGIARQGAD